MRIAPLDVLFRVYTRNEMSEAAMWLLLCAGGLLLHAAVIHTAILGRPGAEAVALACLAAACFVLGGVPSYWTRFAGVVGLTALVSYDLATRMNPVGAAILAACLYHLWKMFRYRDMHEGKVTLK